LPSGKSSTAGSKAFRKTAGGRVMPRVAHQKIRINKTDILKAYFECKYILVSVKKTQTTPEIEPFQNGRSR